MIPTPEQAAWLLVTVVGIGLQLYLAIRARNAQVLVKTLPASELPADFSRSALAYTARRRFERALTHLMVKLTGFVLGVWSTFLPPAVHPARALFFQVAAISFVVMFVLLDWEGFKDLQAWRTIARIDDA